MKGPGNLAELNEMASRPTEAVCKVLRGITSDILVIGAGGKMGFHLSLMLQRALELVDSPHRVVAVSRFGSSTAKKDFESNGIRIISVDLTSLDATGKLPDSENVFFLAGVKFGTSGNPGLLQQMNVEVPQRVAHRFSGSRIVALSTGCVYPFVTPESGGSVETDRVNPPGEYAMSCAGRERAFSESGARTSLIRLNYSVDLRYGVLVDIAQKVLAGSIVDLTTGYANVIWQGDANAYIIQALACAASPPFVINVTGARTLRVRDAAIRFGELFDREVKLVGTENESAWLSNASRSHELWGPPQVDENRLMEWVADWLLAGGTTLNKPTHFEVRDGKY